MVYGHLHNRIMSELYINPIASKQVEFGQALEGVQWNWREDIEW